MKLTPQAKSALEMLNEKHVAYTIAKTTIEAELKRELSSRLASIRHERNVALRLASEAGVPKTQLGRAIGTSNYRTVQEILAETESTLGFGSVKDTSNILLEPVSNGFKVSVNNFGENSVSGSAVVMLDSEGNLEYVDGDAFVLPQIFRNGFAEHVVGRIQDLQN